MSISRYGRRSRQCSAPPTRACRKRRSDVCLSRSAVRRDVELAGNVAALLRQPAKAVGIAADFIEMQASLVVQWPQQLAHALEQAGEMGRLLVFGVGAFANMDVEPVAGELLFRE